MKFMKYHHIENLTNQMLDKFKSSQLYDPSEFWKKFMVLISLLLVTEKIQL